MSTQHNHTPDFGTGQKKISIYLVGFFLCSLLTLISFYIVMHSSLTPSMKLIVIYASALLQFFVQVIFFLRLNLRTRQGKMNLMSLVFTALILMFFIVGSLWIMSNLNYYMMT